MRTLAIAVVVLGLGVLALGGYAFVLHGRNHDLTMTCEGLQMARDMDRDSQVQCSATIADLRQKLANCQAMVDQPPDTAGKWWCYRDRECFASARDCTSAGKEDDRAVECVATAQAWCGGKDGHACFAEPCDCRALEASGGKPCVVSR